MNYTFGTGAMRSGGALVLSILELNKKNITFCEIYYFSRHIFKKYKNLDCKKTKYKISYNFYLILGNKFLYFVYFLNSFHSPLIFKLTSLVFLEMVVQSLGLLLDFY